MSLNLPVEKTFVDSGAAANGSPFVKTTASFTPSANALLVVKVVQNNAVVGDDTSVTITGGSLTWTRRVRRNNNASSTGGTGTDSGAEIWTAPVGGSPSSMTVTATTAINFAGAHQIELVLEVIEVTDTSGTAPTVGNVGAGSSTSGLPSAAISGGVSAGSYVLAVASDWTANVTAGTPGSGQTTIRDSFRSGQVAWHFWRTTSTTSAGALTMNETGPSGQQVNTCAIEIKTSGGGTSQVSQTRVLKWDIDNFVSHTRVLKWDLLNQIAATRTLKWDLLNQVQKAITLRWDLFATVSQTRVLVWDLAGNVARTLTAKWDLSNMTSRTLTAKWDINNFVSRTLTAKWDMSAYANRTVVLRWSINSALIGVVGTWRKLTGRGR